MRYRKAISPVVAMTLLFVVVVVSAVSFQSWQQGFLSELYTSTENQENKIGQARIDVVGRSMYLNSPMENLSIDSIRVENRTCYNATNVSGGISNFSLVDCTGADGGIKEVVIRTKEGIISRDVRLKQADPSLFIETFSPPSTCKNSSNGFHSGDGSASSPYAICNCNQFTNISSNLSGHYEIVKGFSCSSDGSFNGFSSFSGTLTGNSRVIEDFSLSTSSNTFGLFTELTSSSSISNFTIRNLTITASHDSTIGGLAGMGRGSVSDLQITDAYIDGGYQDIGGVLGEYDRDAILTNISFEGELLLANDDDNTRIGGLVGNMIQGDIDSSHAVAIINDTSLGDYDDRYGGLVGTATDIIITDSWHRGTIIGDAQAGGIVGYVTNHGVLRDVVHNGTMKFPHQDWSNNGGIAGELTKGEIIRATANADLLDLSPGKYNRRIGGILGLGEVNISQSTHNGIVGGKARVGGIAGKLTGTVELHQVSHIGEIYGNDTSGKLGGIVGEMQDGSINDAQATGDIVDNSPEKYDGERGGIVGYLNNATITDAHYRGNLKVNKDSAGIVGLANTEVILTNVSYVGNITVHDDDGNSDIAGIIGQGGKATIKNAFSDLQINDSSTGYDDCRAGISGSLSSGSVLNATYTVGRLELKNDDTGGLHGCGSVTIANSFSDIEIINPDAAAFAYQVGSITNSYWNNKTSNPSDGYTSGSSAGLNAISDDSAYFYDQSNAPFPSWDSAAWNWPGSDYPELAAYD